MFGQEETDSFYLVEFFFSIL